MDPKTIRMAAKGNEVEKDGMDIWQTRHIQCQNRRAILIFVAGHCWVQGSLSQRWTGRKTIPIFAEAWVVEEPDLPGQLVRKMSCRCSYHLHPIPGGRVDSRGLLVQGGLKIQNRKISLEPRLLKNLCIGLLILLVVN